MLRIRTTLVLVLATMVIALPMFAADGAAVYKAKCAMCHGADGTGDTPVGKNLKVKSLASAEVQKQTDAQLETIINKGKGKMPAFGAKLSAEELKAVVGFIRTLKK